MSNQNMSLYGRRLSGQQKNVAVAINNGNWEVPEGQGTTRFLYDTLPLDGTGLLQFFKNCQARTFPFTNMQDNKLQLQESMIVKRIYFAVQVMDEVDPTLIVDFQTADAAGLPFIYGGDFTVNFDTVTVVKSTPLTSMNSLFNKDANFASNDVLTLDTNISLQKDLQFDISLKLPPYVAVADTFLRCVIEGEGTIYRPGSQS
jgi:hypothetical protein